MSFPRHGEIFRSDVGSSNAGSRSCGLPLALIGLDEFPFGYSFAGCSSAAPASASPTGGAVCSKLVLLVEEFSSNGEQCLNWLSHLRGEAHNNRKTKSNNKTKTNNKTKNKIKVVYTEDRTHPFNLAASSAISPALSFQLIAKPESHLPAAASRDVC
jgi:hypothetical protein